MTIRVDGTLDIECASWDRFAVAATYDGRGATIHRTLGDLADYLLARAGTHWAHCGGVYDFLALAEEFRARGLSCTIDLSGSRISRIVTGGLTLRDSWPLVPLPLAQAAELAGEAPHAIGLRCTCGHACGGYCQIRPHDPRPSVRDKVAGDARVLYRVLEAVRQIAEDIGLELRGTLGATAYATAKATLDLPDADLLPEQWRIASRGYFGGRVAVMRPRPPGTITHWDISSAYPAALAATALPIGDAIEYGGRAAAGALGNDCPGVYGCKVTVPAMLLPPLPIRGDDRIEYPWGTFTGAWTLPEIQEAMLRGVTIEAVDWAITWDESVPIFSELIPYWYGFRQRAGKHTALGAWLRLLPNTITGKLAERPDRRSARMFPVDEIKSCTLRRPCTRRTCSGKCGAWEQIDRWGHVWSVPFYRQSPSAHIHWAAYLTAGTRAQWLLGMESQGTDAVYGDTDSVWTMGADEDGPRPRGDDLGAWDRKGTARDFVCVGPRAYRYTDGDGGAVIRTAGMPLTDEEWHAGHAENDRGIVPFIQAATASAGLFRRASRAWTLPTRGMETGRYGDRILDASDGLTYPVHYQDGTET